jgi:hypothetical protein
LIERRTDALVDVSRFLRDPMTFEERDPAATEWPLGGLASTEVAWMVRAQAHALQGRHAEAVRCMVRALRLFQPPQPHRSSSNGSESVFPAKQSARVRHARRETAALLRMFIACEAHAAGRARTALRLAAQACDEQPAIAYLHEVRAELAYESGNFDDVRDAIDRATALRGANATAKGRANAATLLAAAALQAARRHGDASENAKVREQIHYALARLEEVDPTKVEERTRTALRYWQGVLRLEQVRLRGEGATRDGDRQFAQDALAEVASSSAAFEKQRASAEAWLAVARGQVWRKLCAGLREPSGDYGGDTAAELRTLASVRTSPGKSRVVIAISRDFLLGDENEVRYKLKLKMIMGLPGAGIDESSPGVSALQRLLSKHYDSAPSVSALKRLLSKHYRLTDLHVGLQPLAGLPARRIEVYLDGVPAGAATVGSTDNLFIGSAISGGAGSWEPGPDWFGRPITTAPEPSDSGSRKVRESEAIVIVAAQMVMQNLDRLLDARHVAALGLADQPFEAWSPTLRLLLADRTPLTEVAALRAAVLSVSGGAATALQAAERYRTLPALRSRLWGAEPSRSDHLLPRELAEELTRCVPPSRALGATGVPERLARDIENWGATTGPSHRVRVVVEDPALRPWLRTLLRARRPDLPVLSRHELSADQERRGAPAISSATPYTTGLELGAVAAGA